VTLRPEVHAHTPACQHHSLRKSTPEEIQLLATNISDFEFTTRTTHVLLSHNINTVCNLVQYTPKELIKLDNFGKKSLQEVIDVLRFEGLTLRGETQ
jgi:DNA-directed RNA polymerase alpha subunit